MRNNRFRPVATVFASLLILAIVILLAASRGSSLALAQVPVPTPTPVLANLPAGVEVVSSAELDLAAGEYEWHVTSLITSNPGDQPLTVHQGMLLAETDAVLVSHGDAGLDQLAKGQALLLDEGEKILPVSLEGVSGAVTLAELVQIVPPATPVPAPPGGFAAPHTVKQGRSIVAILHLPVSSQNDATIATINADAAGPVAELASPNAQSTPVVERERWIIAVLAPSIPDSDQPAPGLDQGNGSTTGGGTPTVTVTATMTPTLAPTMTTTPTTTPIPSEPASVPGTGSGSTVLNPANAGRSLIDDDKDGLSNDGEAVYGTDRTNPDTDGDGIADGPEVDYGTNPLVADSDGDTLSDYREVGIYGTNPLDDDSDGDGLIDGREVNTYGTNPLSKDSDGDRLRDDEELFTYGTEPRVPDTDGDDLTDFSEIFATGTNPNVADSDGDGLSDGAEIAISINPLSSDTDGDGRSDYDEVNSGTDPLIPDAG